MTHPTQIFLSNPQALRAEFRLDDSRLELWWSPLAGESTDCLDRNYSSRDAHLDVFDRIELPGCGLTEFASCEYDPYHTVLRFNDGQALHLAMSAKDPVLLLWTEQAQVIELDSHRFDSPLVENDAAFSLTHAEPRHTFVFAACAGEGTGSFIHCHFHTPGQPRFTRIELAAGQPLALGVDVPGDRRTAEEIVTGVSRTAAAGPEALLAEVEAVLTPVESLGHVVSPRHPELEALRRGVVRGLHSMIDESGTFRASLKAIYYLIWVRDSGFAFPFQAAAGWPHKLGELGRLLLDNPLHVRDEGHPQGRMFGQLIHRDLGKLEEDGLFYVVWVLFTHWTGEGHLDFVTEADWALMDEALEWIETMTWDEARGLYGEFTADETPAHGARDMGWDYAMAKPGGEEFIRWQHQPVRRNYDVYFNTLMHSTHTMLAAMRDDVQYAERADRLWPELHKLLRQRENGIPPYGELLLEDGRRVTATLDNPPSGANACLIWGLSLPNFLPLEDRDAVSAALVDHLLAAPEMHFVNGIASAMAAVDPWFYGEENLLALHQRLAEETNTPGKYLPMGGAMPEKFNAPQGNLYHDIRPQGFAMGAWLAAWSGLGLRRLPYGLALRPTQAFERIEHYPWRGKSLSFHFGPAGKTLALEIDGRRVEGSLQVPEDFLRDGGEVRLVESESDAPLWLRSSVVLNRVEKDGPETQYALIARGPAEITLDSHPDHLTLVDEDGAPIAHRTSDFDGAPTLRFTHFGPANLRTR